MSAVLSIASVFAVNAQTRATIKPADTTKKLPPVVPLGGKTQPKPYDQVITRNAVSRKGMITTHSLDDKYFFEIADSTLGTSTGIIT